MEQSDMQKIKEAAEEFFQKMTIADARIEAKKGPEAEVVELDIKLEEPQILIGERGQTLLEIQRLLRAILSRKTGRIFYLNLDINDYKKKKIEYLKELARDLANEAALTKEEKVLFPMPAYERRVIHAELAQRTDIVTESRGEGLERHIVIKPALK